MNQLIDKKEYVQEIIGKTFENRPLTVEYFGRIHHPNLKFLIIGSQHGDEKYTRKSIKNLIRLLSKMNKKKYTILEDSCISILSNANPDGSILNTRLNSNGIDLNRDHQSLFSEENIFIHSFITRWKPDYIIDVHSYPSKRKYLSQYLSLNEDVLIDIPNNPMIYKLLSRKKMKNFLDNIIKEVTSSGFSCERYFVFSSSGKVRHSTHDITNALNFMTLRYHIPTFLVEGRQPRKNDDLFCRKKLVSAQFTTIYSILRYLYSKQNPKYFHKIRIPKRGDRISIRYSYKSSLTSLKVNTLDLKSHNKKQILLSNYRSSFIPRKKILLPLGYAIPKDNCKLNSFLDSHRFSKLCEDKKNSFYEVEYFYIDKVIFSKQNNRPPLKIHYTVKNDIRQLDNYWIFPINQLGGLILPFFFELNSKYHISRYGKICLPIFENTTYPILRVL